MQTENASGEKGEMLFNTFRTVLWIKLFSLAPYFTPGKSTCNAKVDIFTTSLFITLSPLTYSDWNISNWSNDNWILWNYN